MKQRTAMQTLIHEISKSPISNLSILNLIEDLQLLEMEKDQIMGAYDAYAGFAVWGLPTAEDYYNETFTNDEK
jgi:hypothetical protein